MTLTRSISGVMMVVCLAAPAAAQSLTSTGPYTAVTDRGTYPKPALPALGPAGSAITDPVFQSTIWRITDASTRPGSPNYSYRTPSSPHQNVWSANGSYFYVVSTDGSIIPYAFNAGTGTATRVQPSSGNDGGLVLNFYVEPQFSYVNDSIIYGSLATGSLHTIDQYDFSTGSYSQILDLDAVVGGLSGTYIGGVASSAGSTERLMAMFGGAAQDLHHLVALFDRTNPSNLLLLDTTANTLNGSPTSIPLSFSLHHVAMDRSGRYLMLYPTAADQAGPRQAPQSVVWDTQTGVFTELLLAAHPYGHDSFGYGVSVNQDCCVNTTYDGVQWQFRQLSSPLSTRDVLPIVLQPQEVYVEDHSTWNNARPDRLMPFISGIFRYGTQNGAWRALDDEIVAVETDVPGADPTIWRFAHHRSDVSYDGDPTRVSFWYEPRPNVSHDGQWVLFTSNWEKTLGTDPRGDPGTSARQDVFLLQLRGTGSALGVSRSLVNVDTPGNGAVVPTTGFILAGWAADMGATSGTGVDNVMAWAYPTNGGPVIQVGVASYGGARPDVAAALGTNGFTNSGFGLIATLPPGSYTLAVYAHSTVDDSWNTPTVVPVTVQPPGSNPVMSVDLPGANTVYTQAPDGIVVAGWAVDLAAAGGSGVDAVHVWAYPQDGSPPQWVGWSPTGGYRPDVGAAFGSAQWSTSGFNVIGTLAAGDYTLVVYAHSAVTGTFNDVRTVSLAVR